MFANHARSQHAFVEPHAPLPRSSAVGSVSPEAPSNTLPLSSTNSSMERGPEYSQTGLPSPYPSNFGDTQSRICCSIPERAGSTFSQLLNVSYADVFRVRWWCLPAVSAVKFVPEHIQRAYHPASNHSGSSGGMAQTPTSPSMPLPDGRNHQSQQVKSDNELPIDPNITAPSPTYPHQQYSPYGAPPPGDMSHGYQGSMYNQPRPDWGNYGHPGGHMGQPQSVFTPTSAAPPGRPAQVYSFVPIPGAQQHKRPRRRYEEIERMYKCGWNGCEKAYGTLNHLNAHVTMQSHGQKRTPEEFKEIRKEWKQRKKDEEQQRKAAEEAERQRQSHNPAQVQNGAAGPEGGDGAQPPQPYSAGRSVHLPPIGYSPQYPAPPSAGVTNVPEYSPTSIAYLTISSPHRPMHLQTRSRCTVNVRKVAFWNRFVQGMLTASGR
ncbi:transcriptional regulator [Apiospora phragmitis]|uniref:Transcriptional regulator n=1 Tax=Apiospora phragmitis TaxID=2905665 RepID=A0ABR1W065_9PEZI